MIFPEKGAIHKVRLICGPHTSCVIIASTTVWVWGQIFPEFQEAVDTKASNDPGCCKEQQDAISYVSFRQLRCSQPVLCKRSHEICQREKQIKDLCIGSTHIAILTEIGNVWVWGYGVKGELGLGNRKVCQKPEKVFVNRDREYIENANYFDSAPIQAISVGWSHSVVVTEKGNVWAWGSNSFGECGLKTMLPYYNEPTLVDLSMEKIKYSTLILLSSCYCTTLLHINGKVFIWGLASENKILMTPTEISTIPRQTIMNSMSLPGCANFIVPAANVLFQLTDLYSQNTHKKFKTKHEGEHLSSLNVEVYESIAGVISPIVGTRKDTQACELVVSIWSNSHSDSKYSPRNDFLFKEIIYSGQNIQQHKFKIKLDKVGQFNIEITCNGSNIIGSPIKLHVSQRVIIPDALVLLDTPYNIAFVALQYDKNIPDKNLSKWRCVTSRQCRVRQSCPFFLLLESSNTNVESVKNLDVLYEGPKSGKGRIRKIPHSISPLRFAISVQLPTSGQYLIFIRNRETKANIKNSPLSMHCAEETVDVYNEIRTNLDQIHYYFDRAKAQSFTERSTHVCSFALFLSYLMSDIKLAKNLHFSVFVDYLMQNILVYDADCFERYTYSFMLAHYYSFPLLTSTMFKVFPSRIEPSDVNILYKSYLYFTVNFSNYICLGHLRNVHGII